MADYAQGLPDVGMKRTLARWNPEVHMIRSPMLRYGFSVASVAIALVLALIFQYYQFREVEVPVLALSIALTTWYAGTGPSVLAIVLSAACFDYFFTEPFYTLSITSRDLPYFFVFIAWGVIVASFSAVRRRIEDSSASQQAPHCRGRRRRNSDSLTPTIEASASSPSQRSSGNSDNVRGRAAPSSKPR